ncbi:MAG: RnfABCDGE type electron transport complex subunit D [Succinivibrionaceae bacterium]
MQDKSLKIESAPHDLSITATGKVMRTIIYTLIPAILAEIYFFGFGIVVNLILCALSCTITEAIILKIRKKKINVIWRDSSALVTAVILAITLPPLTPWYLTVIGCIIAIGVAKHIYGGLGQNIFNPAMIGFVFLLISAPLPLTTYVNAIPENYKNITLTRASQIIFNIKPHKAMKKIRISLAKSPYISKYLNNDGTLMSNLADINAKKHNADGLTGASLVDSFTGATFLVDAKHEQPNHNVDKFTAKAMATESSYNHLAHEVLSICFILGGIILIILKAVDWRIPISFLVTSSIFIATCYILDPTTYLSPFQHLIFGATFFGAFYIMTDPVTAVSKPTGAIIYGSFIGLIFVIIRNFGGYPDAIAFSVLIGNAVAPLISILTKRKEFGANSKPGDLND